MSTLQKKERLSSMEFVRKYAVIITALVMVLLGVALTGGTFLSGNNMLNVGERAAMVGIVALGLRGAVGPTGPACGEQPVNCTQEERQSLTWPGPPFSRGLPSCL